MIKRIIAIGLTIVCCVTLYAEAHMSQMEIEYNAIAKRFEERDNTLRKDLKTYLKTYPYTTYEDEVRFMSGALEVEKGHYKKALKDLEQVEFKALSRSHQTQYQFYRGYAYLMQQEYSRASVYFAQLRKGDSDYKQKGSYYYAYCQYKLGNYDKALPVLLELENEQEYKETIPYYLVQIYYAQGNADEVTIRAEELLKNQPDNENNLEIHRILGEMYYQKGDYKNAISNLKAYEKSAKAQSQELVRNDVYLLAMAEYKLGSYQESVDYFKQVKQLKDTISESTCLTLGNAFIKLGKTEHAKLSFQAAASYNLTPQIREEALYNYTLCTYSSSTALGESVKAFRDFLNEYPNSKYTDKVYILLSDAFLKSKNYAQAIAVLDSIPTQNSKMLETKQYLRYQLGVDNFLQGKMDQSREWMQEVISHNSESSKYSTEAYYWSAEAAYRLRDYSGCLRNVEQFLSRSDAKTSDNYTMASYLAGYSQFSLKNYDKARTYFLRYINAASSSDPTYADALNRIGDCYFNARDFNSAISYYGQVIDRNATGSDYATFQRGYAQGLQHKYGEKIQTMQTLVSRYPKSDYADDGLYEIARAQLQQDNNRAAISTYEQLLSAYPNSNLARKASLERAMLYRNEKMYTEAIAAYKQTIDDYPATDEAYSALEGLEAICVEQGNVSDYLAYTKSLQGYNMKVTTKDDSLSYTAAELQYMQGNYTKASTSLASYIKSYCSGGRYCTSAQYYLADSYYRLGKTTEALQEYKTLAELSGNPYMEEACTRVAELSYDKKDYQTSLEYFYRMLSMASTREKTDVARLGILRCSYYLGRHQSTIDIAEQILTDEPVDADVKQEALYNRAKAYVALKQYRSAITDLKPLAKEVRTAIGAESKYLLADCYYELSSLDESEQEIMSFTQMDTQQQYWLARALILLSDINLRKGDEFQAKQYLLTLKNNYTQQDDIQTIVQERLAALESNATTTNNDVEEDDND